MCGIIACRTIQPAVEYLCTGLRRLEYRGYDSVGVALQTATAEVAHLRTVERIGALDELVRGWSGAPLNGVGIGHTRWATHGLVSEENAHPHADCNRRIFVAHNGIILNADQLRDELTRSGHRIATAVDSEVLSHLIEDALSEHRDLFKAVQTGLTRVQGTWAIAVLERGTGRIVVASNGSPLLVAHSAHGVFAASDIAAIVDWTDEFQVLGDGDVVELVDGGQWVRAEADSVPLISRRCSWQGRDADLNGYSDFMAKEINEQPAAACRVIDDLGTSIDSGELWTDRGLGTFDRLKIIGCGTSMNAGLVIGNVVRRLGRIPVTCTIASEAADDIPETGQLTLAISQSGETADVLQALTSDAIGGAPLVALTNNQHSSLARRADAVLNCDAGPEIGVAATKTFVCQVIAGAALMISGLSATGRIDRSAAARLTDDLRRLPEKLAAALNVAQCRVPPLIEELSDCAGFIFIAKGSGLPYAAEGALKLKELTYRWAEHYPAGELKHGPLALIGAGTPVVVVDNGDTRLRANMAEIAARGGQLLTIGSADSAIDVASDPSAAWGPLEATVPLQVLARTLALSLGHDVDKPRNLAKSVTVQ
ncbi:glucosamine--fructose-6-phosphate aminotransferase, isomerizing [Mycolicibacterium chubuense NBB4]|uniref:Glutamine--fructose-6-phosphate aminotransferase [isomerizing] n=1 Tax=Mycolicibacterium chubuense (strain NBB4) TaxID=710421 RepID=I4BPV5_MYCCN|nr:glutamine--fructose-6-phosphate transaminase (isomerizing) [Mycolicibacterium chubuense]AFM19312.1 glucosamine--fructose-6-phosphate aminotransferase, isomerizing [Mycolicibacterium chubuense NBB4]